MPDISWCRRGGSRGYVTITPVNWGIGKKGSEWVLTIPAGREFESSVPRLVRWIFSPDDPYYLKAALVHDHLLEAGYDTDFCDSQWRAAALSTHAPPFKTRLIRIAMQFRRFFHWIMG